MLVPAILVAAGCGADFMETNPPQLVRARSEYVASSTPEPLVWFVVADLYLENPADCPAALAYLDASVKAAMPAAALSSDLGRISLSPCTQPVARTLDPTMIDDAVRRAELAFAGHAVRAVLLYVNNLALAPPPQVTDGLLTARARIGARSGLAPRIWTSLVAGATPAAVPSDHSVPWGYVGDPGYPAALAKSLSASVPFVSDDAVVAGPMPLLPGDELLRTREFKVCAADEGISAIGFAADGSTVGMDSARPPLYRVALKARRALEQTGFQPLRVHVDSEICTDHCDRLFHYQPGSEPVRWNASRGCLLQGGSR
jgi:hypothetical protein